MSASSGPRATSSLQPPAPPPRNGPGAGWWGISSNEAGKTALLFAVMFLASLVFVMGRTARDALFLTSFPITWVAYMWVGYGVVASAVAFGYEWLSARFGRKQFTIFLSVGAMLSYVGVRLLVGAQVRWSIAFFYIWAEVVANLFILQSWAITNDLNDPRSARRLYGVIGAGRVSGMLLSGFVTGSVVRLVGTANLIYVVAGVMAVYAALIWWIARVYPLPKARIEFHQPTPSISDRPMPFGNYRSNVIILAIMLLAVFITLTIGDYQFKAIAKIAYPHRERLAEYMANFYAVMGAVALVFQLFLTPRILKRLGVMGALFTMPVAFLSGTALLLFYPILPIATMMKVSDNGLQYTIHDSTVQLLYFAFPPALRTRARAILDAMVKPLGYSLGGVVLVVLAPQPLHGESSPHLAHRVALLGIASLISGAVWLLSVPSVRKQYVESLRRGLLRFDHQGPPDLDNETAVDPTIIDMLLDTIKNGAPTQILFAMDRLQTVAPERLIDTIPHILGHDDPIVRDRALQLGDLLPHDQAANVARAMMLDPDERVRCSAVELLAKTLQDDALDELAPYLEDGQSSHVRAAVMAALMANGGLSGMLEGGSRLKAMLTSAEPKHRKSAALILGEIGDPSLARTLRPLLRDDDPAVRRAALKAASTCAAPSLIPDLIEALAQRPLVKLASAALAFVGEVAVPSLRAALCTPETARPARMAIPRILHAIGTPEALTILRSQFGDPDEGVRQKVYASASRLRETLQAPAMVAVKLRPYIELEIASHETLREQYALARPWIGRPLLDEQICYELRGNVVRILRLCEQVYPRDQVAAARHGILSNDHAIRATALEVLDNVLTDSNRDTIVHLMGSFGAYCHLSDVSRHSSAPVPDSVSEWVQQRLALPGNYRRGLLLEAIAAHHASTLAPFAKAYVNSRHPFARENALMSVVACQLASWHQMVLGASSDQSSAVKSYANYVLETGQDGLEQEDEMYTTVEKIILLQRVPLFAGATGRDLMPLANAASVLTANAGEILFREGDTGDALYVIFHGKVSLTRAGHHLDDLEVGEVFGEMGILDDLERLVTATASEEADLLKLGSEDFLEALRDSPDIAAGVIHVLTSRLRHVLSADRVFRDGDRQQRRSLY